MDVLVAAGVSSPPAIPLPESGQPRPPARAGSVSPASTKEVSQAKTGSSVKISAVRVEVVYRCAQACMVNANAVAIRPVSTTAASMAGGPADVVAFRPTRKCPNTAPRRRRPANRNPFETDFRRIVAQRHDVGGERHRTAERKHVARTHGGQGEALEGHQAHAGRSEHPHRPFPPGRACFDRRERSEKVPSRSLIPSEMPISVRL